MIKFLLLVFIVSNSAIAGIYQSKKLVPHLPIEILNLKNLENKDYEFEGIIKLSNCSGALVQFEGMAENKKAMVLTNGHCADLPGGVFIQPGKAIYNKPVKRTVGIFDSSKSLHRVSTTKFLYATMTVTDISLYELELTYQQIKDQFDIDPYVIASTHPVLNVETQIISGYWERGYDCTMEAFVPTLREDAYTWTDSLRYNEGCDTIHGTSGSPILERNTRTVIGINNTGNDSGGRCTMDNPCEVGRDGTITVRHGISYGQQTYILYSCLNANFEFDFTKTDCLLTKP